MFEVAFRWRPGRVAIVVGFSLAATPAAIAQPACAPLPPPAGEVIEVDPTATDDLRAIVAGAASGTTILLADGFYDLSGGDGSHRLSFETAGVTLRSASGERDAVVLDGGYVTSELVSILASQVTVADLTLSRAFDHPIHLSGTPGNPITGVVLHNLRIVDPGQQAVKINPNGDGYVDDGVVECSSIELTDAGRAEIRDSCYTGGIDAHQAWGWVVRRNRIAGFWCDDGLAEHAVHFWKGSRDTVVEENVIVDSARGIGFGLGASGESRPYPDDPYPGVGYLGHIDGIARNNFIAAADPRLFATADGFDTGIGLEQARGARVVHNTVASTTPPLSSSIEWRFGNTLAEIANNLVTDQLLARDGAQATLAGNIDFCPPTWLAGVEAGDLHLTAAAAPAVDAGGLLAPGVADFDIDVEVRDARPDVGGDEVGGAIFGDGFESGDLSAWSAAVG